ncbi:hypothetical protein BCR37DRAFT_36631 [Protomyces lactucae-debilis]|uniref:Uncharacterized protein n=1 Tax=Protomyces lactucae-debilis TaxID=2754530 RepID=A0A1Y2FDS7_PROLT|nr:uncharacterized protein BCR37DRAFT_36631 [Protomyces lactucae-debilis]ORY82078.1 hypothetical protein BCR37DRAFT_36631 [Protomyces lactucae-debilis]
MGVRGWCSRFPLARHPKPPQATRVNGLCIYPTLLSNTSSIPLPPLLSLVQHTSGCLRPSAQTTHTMSATTTTNRLPSFSAQNPVKRKKSSVASGVSGSIAGSVSSRSTSIALSAECLYSMQEPSATNLNATQQFHRPSLKRAAEPVLIRYLRCSAVLPIPLQQATRVIAMFKCFRKVLPAGARASATPTMELLYSHFTRIWPKEQDVAAGASAQQEEGVQSLVMYDQNSRVDFVLPVAEDLPQSLSLPGGGSIYYTLQIQANLPIPGKKTGEASMYSQELVVSIPAPESAYSPSRLPRRITTANMTGHAQDHFGILITPDISLHVSVPQEIHYARQQHSVFKIHIKLMPHPPEAKLPAIAKLEWKLTQRTHIGKVNTAGTSDWPSAGVFPESPTKSAFNAHNTNNAKPTSQSKKNAKLGESKATLASGIIAFANAAESSATPGAKGRFSSASRHVGQGAAAQAKHAAEKAAESDAGAEDAMMGGSRKDQYLYIALPEQSALLQPMSDGNPFLEILHQLEIELFPFHAQNVAGGANGSGNNTLSKTFWHWRHSLSAWGGGGKNKPGSYGEPAMPGQTHARERWQAEIPVKITLAFDQHEKLTTAVTSMTPAARSLSSGGPSPALPQGNVRGERGFNGPALITPGPGFGHGGKLAISSGA